MAAILVANAVGGLLAGVLLASLPEEAAWRLFLVMGFLGALTTLSSVTMEVTWLWHQQLYLKGLGLLAAHNSLALGATLAGYFLVHWARSVIA